MATFEETRGMRNQEHFEVLEIDLPVINGACTIGGEPGYGTPLSCDQAWAGEYKTYKFTNVNAPILPGSIFRCIKSINEITTTLKPGEGLAGRGSLSIAFIDFDRQDPNIAAPGVSEKVKNQGTYFGKLSERQVFENKKVRLKLYRVQEDGSVDLVNGAQARHYIAESFDSDGKGVWKLKCKDGLNLANLNEVTWPQQGNSFLRQDITEDQTVLQVDNETDYSSVQVIRIGDEHMRVTGVDTSDPADHKIQVDTRGNSILSSVTSKQLTETVKESHSAGDEVFLCELSEDERIDDLISRILVDSGFDSSLIPYADWAAEVDEWHSTTRIETIHSEPLSANKILKKILESFLMDMWFDSTDNEAKLSAISAWKKSTARVVEGAGITKYTINKTPKNELRASRALITYDKRNLSENDDFSNYKKAARFSDNTIIGDELYAKHKDKTFDGSTLIDKEAAELLTQRYVSRFKFTPYLRPFDADERYINYKVGDVVDIESEAEQSFDGSRNKNLRGQITKINPQYTQQGRKYKVEAMTYEAAFSDNSEIVLDAPLDEVNLYILAGAPSQPVTITFVLTAYSQGATAIRAGNFANGSKIILILANGFIGLASGGSGGRGSSVFIEGPDTIITPPEPGFDGGTVYNAQGIDTDVYFSGATPSALYPTADGYIYAPNGGDAGESGGPVGPGDGGDGGNGRLPGSGGPAGESNIGTAQTGSNGVTVDDGSGWGQDGASTTVPGGAAGSGILSGGATVVLYGQTGRYVKGNGDV